MTMNDPLAALLSEIKNAEAIGKKEVISRCNSKLIRKILEVLNGLSFIGGVEEVPSQGGKALKISLLGNINNIGVIKPRYPVKLENFESFERRYLPAKNFGVIILSTSKGIMIHNEAKEQKIGGKLLMFCY